MKLRTSWLIAGLLVSACSGKPERISLDKKSSAIKSVTSNEGNAIGTNSDGDPDKATALVPIPKRIRLMSFAEMTNTLAAIFGQKTTVSLAAIDFGRTLANGFKNGQTLALDARAAESWLDTAGQVAAWAKSANLLTPYLKSGCTPWGASADQVACRTNFVNAIGRRLYRHTLTAAETKDALDIYQSSVAGDSETPENAFTAMLQFMLASPKFLYRTELGDGKPDATGRVRLTSIEMASALSFFIASTGPDDALIDAGEKGLLTDPAQVEAQARRLIDAKRMGAMFQEFFVQWLMVDSLPTVIKNMDIYPDWSSDIAGKMLDETSAFVTHVVNDDDANLKTIFEAPYTYTDSALAQFYGLTDTSGTGIVKRDLSGLNRYGIFNQGAFLTTQSGYGRSSPVRRGVKLLRNVMCVDIAPPPANVAPAPDGTNTGAAPKTTRELFAAHTNSARCAACHTTIDPIGDSFENFDAVGRYRSTEAGLPIDAAASTMDAGLLDTDAYRITFNDSHDMFQKLLGTRELAACFADNLFRYTFGKYPSDEEKASMLTPATDHFVSNQLDMKSLMIEMVKSDVMSMRKNVD